MNTVVIHGQNYRPYNYLEFLCDDVADIDSLPVDKASVAISSLATCLKNKVIYILNNQRKWVPFQKIPFSDNLPGDYAPPIVGQAIVGETRLGDIG